MGYQSSFRPLGYIAKIHPIDGSTVVIAGGGHWLGSDGPVASIAADAAGNIWFANRNIWYGSESRVRVLEPLPAPPQAEVRLPGGGAIRLTKQEDGSGWRIGETPVESGHVYARGGTEYVLSRVGEQWRVAGASVPLGTSGDSAEILVLADGTLVRKRTGQPLDSGSLVTASNFDTYRVTVGTDGISTAFVPRSQTVQVERGGAALQLNQDASGAWRSSANARLQSVDSTVNGGWEYRLEYVQGTWHASLVRPVYSIRSVVGGAAVNGIDLVAEAH